MNSRIATLLASLLIVGALPLAATAQQAVPTSPQQIDLTFAPLVKSAAPAVVNIYTRTKVKERRVAPFFDDPFFQQFFGDQFKFSQPKERVQSSLGSGVIVRADGLIVTNNHVIEGADQIRVVLADKREYEARILAAEERLDLALLKIDTAGEQLPVLPLRDSDELEVGDLVLAIGNPFGVGQTVTSGIVSGVARTNTGIGDYGYFIQTDAAINPGNSGGALIGTDGRLVGIPTAIFSKTGGSVGIGFAIPANMVAAVIKAEGQGGKFVRPWVGAAGETVTADIAKSLGLARPGGVVVQELYPEGPAARAGIRPGDVILGVNGRPVEDPEGLRFRLATLPVGAQATINALRKGEKLDLAVDLIPPPDKPAADEILLDGRQPLAGALVVNLSPAAAEELNIGAWSGVAIAKIRRGSIADRAGFEPGDVIVKLNEQTVASTRDLAAALEGTRAPWSVAVDRGGTVRTFRLD
ncbi:serine protease Do [Dongia mobilis]|uniref:Serine protease Do n=1 Tax=Dongia mobilis TaxID=578943 RepID=A0A4R6WUW8_9PROT|nr:Do family serine endopeptidase [Dongia mobilis]TDQ83804.1 serine protease Do [Dongia mobilis]